jgi:hypothetical protein
MRPAALGFCDELSRAETDASTVYQSQHSFNMKAAPPESVTDPDDPLRPHLDLWQ